VSIIYKALKQLEQLPDTEAIVFPDQRVNFFWQGRRGKRLVIGIVILTMIFLGIQHSAFIFSPLAAVFTKIKVISSVKTVLSKPVITPQADFLDHQHLAFSPPVSLINQKNNPIPRVKKVTPIQHIPHDQPQVKPKKIVRLIKATPVTGIDTLIQQLYRAISANQVSQVTALLAQLSQQMGQQNGFVIKLKAYWLLKQKHYHQVETLLQPYVLQHPKDLEAGINLSMAEIQRDPEVALSRLQQLNRWYPDHQMVQSLLAQVSK